MYFTPEQYHGKYINDHFTGLSSVSATGSSFSFLNVSLKAGDSLKVYAQTSGACMTVSGAIAVSAYIQPPVITTNSAGNLLTSSSSIGGTSSIPGATVTLYRGLSPSGVSVGTALVNSSGNWVVNGLTLTANQTYYAIQSSGGIVSPSSQSATVLGPTNVVPVFSSPTYLDLSTSIDGSVPSFSETIQVYLDGMLIGIDTLTSETTWTVPTNTNYTNRVYSGGALTVTAKTSTGAESTVSTSTATVTCTSPPPPTITGTPATIITGQAATFTISNVTINTWYAVTDNTGSSYATSHYTPDAHTFTLPTKAFNTAGTYNLSVTADKLTGYPLSSSSVVVTVNN